MKTLLRLLALLPLLVAAANAQPVGSVPFSALPNCVDTSGKHLNYTSATGAFSCGTSTSIPSVVNTQSGTSYTLQASDCGATILFTSGSAITLTTLNSLPAGCYINIEQGGAGQVTVSGSPASAHAFTKTAAQYAIIGLFVDTNAGGTSAHYVLFGDGA